MLLNCHAAEVSREVITARHPHRSRVLLHGLGGYSRNSTRLHQSNTTRATIVVLMRDRAGEIRNPNGFHENAHTIGDALSLFRATFAHQLPDVVSAASCKTIEKTVISSCFASFVPLLFLLRYSLVHFNSVFFCCHHHQQQQQLKFRRLLLSLYIDQA